jgi:hypothetical protein
MEALVFGLMSKSRFMVRSQQLQCLRFRAVAQVSEGLNCAGLVHRVR